MKELAMSDSSVFPEGAAQEGNHGCCRSSRTFHRARAPPILLVKQFHESLLARANKNGNVYRQFIHITLVSPVDLWCAIIGKGG